MLLLFATHFTAHLDRALPAVVAPALKAEFQLTDGQLGVLLGPAFGLAFVFGNLLIGRWTDRAHRHRLLGWSLLVWSAASVAFAASRTWEHLLAARLLLGLGQAALAPAALSLLLQGAPDGRGGRKVAAFTSGAALGRSGALLLGGGLLAAIAAAAAAGAETGLAPWRVLFLVMTVPNLPLAILLFRRAEPARPPGGAARRGEVAAWARREAPAVGAQLACGSAAILLGQSLGAWAPSLFNRAGGLDGAGSALLAGLVVLTAAPLGHMLGGTLADRARRRGRPPTTVAALLLATAAPCAALLGAAQGAPALAAAYFALTLCLGAAAVAVLAGFQPLVPQRLRGTANAAYFATVTLVGLGLGPPLVGVLNDGFRLGGEDRLALALALVVVAVALPAAFWSLAAGRWWTRAADRAERSPD